MLVMKTRRIERAGLGSFTFPCTSLLVCFFFFFLVVVHFLFVYYGEINPTVNHIKKLLHTHH